MSLGLDCASDDAIWDYARDNDFLMVTKDADYNNLGVLRGFPPKILWLLIGNCTTKQVEDLLRASHVSIEEFERDTDIGTLCLR